MVLFEAEGKIPRLEFMFCFSNISNEVFFSLLKCNVLPLPHILKDKPKLFYLKYLYIIFILFIENQILKKVPFIQNKVLDVVLFGFRVFSASFNLDV